MLLQSDRQLGAARRLDKAQPGQSPKAQFPSVAGAIAEEGSPADKKRRVMVEYVARELLENLLFAGSENPVVEEVRQELDRELGAHYTYKYPPGELNLQIIKESPTEKRELDAEEKRAVLEKLWAITLAKVDATML